MFPDLETTCFVTNGRYVENNEETHKIGENQYNTADVVKRKFDNQRNGSSGYWV